MNFKKTALVLAMAGVVATPITAQAAAGEGAYASIRIGLQVITKGTKAGTDDESTTISGAASRFGFKSSTDLGNGMTGFGSYQFSVNSDSTDATIGNRHAYAGIKGDFGAISVGRENATFYDHAVGVNDIPWNGSGSAMVAYRGRTSNNLTYAGSADSLSYGVTLQMDDSGKTTTGDQEVIDAMELGLSYDAGFGKFGFGYLTQKADKKGVDAVASTAESGTIAGGDFVPATLGTAAVDAEVDPEPTIGLALSGIAAGPVTLGFGYQLQDVVDNSTSTRSTNSILFDVGFNNVYVHYETFAADKTGGIDDKTSLAIGYTKSFGPQTSAWFEYHDVATEKAAGDNTGDSNEIRAIMKYDI